MQFLGYAVSLCSVVGDTRLVGVVTKSRLVRAGER